MNFCNSYSLVCQWGLSRASTGPHGTTRWHVGKRQSGRRLYVSESCCLWRTSPYKDITGSLADMQEKIACINVLNTIFFPVKYTQNFLNSIVRMLSSADRAARELLHVPWYPLSVDVSYIPIHYSYPLRFHQTGVQLFNPTEFPILLLHKLSPYPSLLLLQFP